jgi:predicted transglutaminase-like cysteine proteinase
MSMLVQILFIAMLMDYPRADERPSSLGTLVSQSLVGAYQKKNEDYVLPQASVATVPRAENEKQRLELSELPGIQALRDAFLTKWAELQPRIRHEREMLASCRSAPDTCSRAARRFLQIVELGSQQQARARLGVINRAVNLSIKPVSDWVQYGVDDFWSPPLATLDAGAGDCEDYAILKYVALREAGISSNDLRILVVRYPRRKMNHAVIAARLDQEWLILDNLTLTMVSSLEARRYYQLLVALDDRGLVAFDSAEETDRFATHQLTPLQVEVNGCADRSSCHW